MQWSLFKYLVIFCRHVFQNSWFHQTLISETFSPKLFCIQCWFKWYLTFNVSYSLLFDFIVDNKYYLTLHLEFNISSSLFVPSSIQNSMLAYTIIHSQCYCLCFCFKLCMTFYVSSYDIRHSMLVIIVLSDFISDIQCYIKLNQTFSAIPSLFFWSLSQHYMLVKIICNIKF